MPQLIGVRQLAAVWFRYWPAEQWGDDAAAIARIAPPLARRHNIGMARLRPRWRMVKWVGLVVVLLLAILWPFSLKREIFYAGDGVAIAVADGSFYIVFGPVWKPATNPASLAVRDAKDASNCAYLIARLTPVSRWRPSVTPERCLVMPVWILMVFAGTATTILWSRDRRLHPRHCCQNCGYDLTGNTSGVCPECGLKRVAGGTGQCSVC